MKQQILKQLALLEALHLVVDQVTADGVTQHDVQLVSKLDTLRVNAVRRITALAESF